MKYTTAVLGQNESCGSSIAEESKILLILFRALKGGQNMVLGKGNTVVWTRLSVGRGIFLLESFVPVLVHSERECKGISWPWF